ncbi:hypothetical protein CL629_04065 [bacterium]|nr:hypothetical protein [bacterium]
MTDQSSTKESKNSLGAAVSLAWGLGYKIALPIVALGLLGRFLDIRLGTSFIFLLVGIFVSLALSSLLIYQQIKQIIKDQEKDNKEI